MRCIRGLFVATLLGGIASCGGETTTPSSPGSTTTTTTPVVSSSSTTTTTAPVVSSSSTTSAVPPSFEALVLRRDGVGPFDFGTDRGVVAAWLTDLLGEPDSVEVNGVEGFRHMLFCGSAEVHRWTAVGLSVGFSDLLPGPVAVPATGCASGLRLWAWDLVPAAGGMMLTTELGFGVGDTAAAIRSSGQPVAWEVDEGGYPTSFAIVAQYPYGLWGDVDWDWIGDLQRALNEHGAHLAVDGRVGPRTRAAVEAYRVAHDLSSVHDVLRVLLDPDDDAPITLLWAGYWFWEYECGSLEAWGWDGC